MLGRVSSLDFFVSLSFMPLSMALAGPLSKVIPVQAIFAAAGLVPIVLAAVALTAARMPQDEIAHPLKDILVVGSEPVDHGESQRDGLTHQ